MQEGIKLLNLSVSSLTIQTGSMKYRKPWYFFMMLFLFIILCGVFFFSVWCCRCRLWQSGGINVYFSSEIKWTEVYYDSLQKHKNSMWNLFAKFGRIDYRLRAGLILSEKVLLLKLQKDKRRPCVMRFSWHSLAQWKQRLQILAMCAFLFMFT